MIAAKTRTAKTLTPAAKALAKLWRDYKRAPHDIELRNRLIEHYLHLVRYQAARIYAKLPSEVDLDDLVSAGVFGLVDAIRGFDLKRKLKFETFSCWRIRGAILDSIRDNDWVPRLIRSKASKTAAAIADLSRALGRDPTREQIAARLELSIEGYEELQLATRAVGRQSLHRPIGIDEECREIPLIAVVDDPRAEIPTSSSQHRDLMRLVTKSLNKTERVIVIGYYYEHLTMKQIAESLGLSESRVSQLHSQIIERLRKTLRNRREEFAA